MVSPNPQYPQPAAYGPGMLAPPPQPDSIKRATTLMVAGAALSIVSAIVTGLTTHHDTFYTTTSTSGTTTVHLMSVWVSAALGAVISCLLWLWMAWKTRDGRKWARVLSTVFFGFNCLLALFEVVGAANDHAVLAFVFVPIQLGLGLAALIYLWRAESTQFFAAAGVAKFFAGYPPQYPGGFNPASYAGNQPPYGGTPAAYGDYQAPGSMPSAQYGQPPANNDPQQPAQ